MKKPLNFVESHNDTCFIHLGLQMQFIYKDKNKMNAKERAKSKPNDISSKAFHSDART